MLFIVNKNNPSQVISVLREVADALEKGDLQYVSGGIAIRGTVSVSIDSDLRLESRTDASPTSPAPVEHGRQRMTVRIRRFIDKIVRPEAEQIDGKTYWFKYGWEMDQDDPYPGETVLMPDDPAWPIDAPSWIASGDLVNAELPDTKPSENVVQVSSGRTVQ